MEFKDLDVELISYTENISGNSAKGKQLGRPPLSSQAIDEIRAMKKNGTTLADIKRKTGLSKNTVKKIYR